jgi:hypothetical protein
MLTFAVRGTVSLHFFKQSLNPEPQLQRSATVTEVA